MIVTQACLFSLDNIHSREGYMVDIHRKMKQEQIQLDISLEFQKLTKEIQNYRLRLINPNERNEFEEIWGLDNKTGNFIKPKTNLLKWIYSKMFTYDSLSISDIISKELYN